ncbi:hypothetical protein [Paenibacillus kobensis]|uniref:hypothetical protein n=1 Tax=Paenibacillus kobensis TaxID=59841 RepID=UPI000FDAC62E|nr:hypothetical protein [Paenibacillus kobensis]
MSSIMTANEEFEKNLKEWLDSNRVHRKGESLRRLENGIGYGEKLFLEQVWWPVVGTFDHLFPEYLFIDDAERERFIDLAYVRVPYRFAIEIDGYGPHVKNVDRYQFGDGLMRQNQLVMEGWKPIRFSVTDLEQRPDRCIRFVRSMLGQWYGKPEADITLLVRERQLIHLAVFNHPFVDASIIAAEFSIRREHASKWLRRLHNNGLLTPLKAGERIHRYRYSEKAVRMLQI